MKNLYCLGNRFHPVPYHVPTEVRSPYASQILRFPQFRARKGIQPHPLRNSDFMSLTFQVRKGRYMGGVVGPVINLRKKEHGLDMASTFAYSPVPYNANWFVAL